MLRAPLTRLLCVCAIQASTRATTCPRACSRPSTRTSRAARSRRAPTSTTWGRPSSASGCSAAPSSTSARARALAPTIDPCRPERRPNNAKRRGLKTPDPPRACSSRVYAHAWRQVRARPRLGQPVPPVPAVDPQRGGVALLRQPRAQGQEGEDHPARRRRRCAGRPPMAHTRGAPPRTPVCMRARRARSVRRFSRIAAPCCHRARCWRRRARAGGPELGRLQAARLQPVVGRGRVLLLARARRPHARPQGPFGGRRRRVDGLLSAGRDHTARSAPPRPASQPRPQPSPQPSPDPGRAPKRPGFGRSSSAHASRSTRGA